MPLKQCSKDNKSGWKFGDGGHCYTGKDGKKKALRQGVAIHGPQKFAEIMKSESIILDQDLIADLIYDEDTPIEMLDDLLHQYHPTNILDHVCAAEYVLTKKEKKNECKNI